MVAGCAVHQGGISDPSALVDLRGYVDTKSRMTTSGAPPRSDEQAGRFQPWRRGIEYGLAIYAAGFAFGVLRALVVAPKIGERSAELLEVPLMLVVGFVLAGRVRDRLHGYSRGVLVCSGLVGVLVLLALEVATSVLLLGGSVRDGLVNPDPVAGAFYYATVLVLVALPALRGRSRAAPRTPH